MTITAVVVCDARVDGPGPVAPIGGVPMVVYAVRSLLDSGLVDHVELSVTGAVAETVAGACRGLPVSPHVVAGSEWAGAYRGQRARPRRGDGLIPAQSESIRPESILVLHDACRPLAPPELVAAVVAEVGAGHDAAVPALPMTDTVKQVDAAGTVTATPDRSALRVVQSPLALRADLLAELGDDWGGDLDGDLLRITPARLVESGVEVHTVPGHPLAFPVCTAWDLELAEMLVAAAGGQRDGTG